MTCNGIELVIQHGSRAYPFTPQKLGELEVIDEERRERQTLEYLLVTDLKDFLVRKSGSKVIVQNKTNNFPFTSMTRTLHVSDSYFSVFYLGSSFSPG